ncbi:MAG: sulfotransferase, partial [Actinomycetota bacterium]|nr:sulfotransferase [Actinomycetota bacterium]
WYRTHFPLRAGRHGRVTFEATPHYLFHPLAPARAARLLPDARFVVLLRDPVERAISHYELQTRTGVERLDFAAAIAAEPARLAGEVERLRADPAYPAAALHHYSYLARGRYAEQLAAWLRHFPPERLHVVRSEDLFAEPAATYRGILSFLGLSEWLPARFPNYSDTPAPRPDRRAERALLAGVFSDANARLAELVGRDFGWEV